MTIRVFLIANLVNSLGSEEQIHFIETRGTRYVGLGRDVKCIIIIFKNWAIPGLFFFIFVISVHFLIQLIKKLFNTVDR